jgi:general stress protein 26
MDPAGLKATCLHIMKTAETVYLTTIDQAGYPHTQAMFNLRNKEKFSRQVAVFADHQRDYMIYLSTNTSSRKLVHIKYNPKVCLYYRYPSTFRSRMLAGEIEIVDSSEARGALWNEGWERYYPSGPEDPDHTALRLFPAWGQGWCGGERFEFQIEQL